MHQTTPMARNRLFPVLLIVIVAALAWWQQNRVLSLFIADHDSADQQHSEDEHAHDHGSGDDRLPVSDAARANLGLTAEYLWPVAASAWSKSVSIPGVVRAQPGTSVWHVSAPLTGVVTKVLAISGEAVLPGVPLFEIRLTHEELVSAQTGFLQLLGELDVEQEEISRLEQVAAGGAVAQRTLLERVYARDRLLASLSAHRESLLLHGMTPDQVAEIETQRKLVGSLVVLAPQMTPPGTIPPGTTTPAAATAAADGAQLANTAPPQMTPLVISAMSVTTGQAVTSGEHLCELVNLSQLQIEGQAFESDLPALRTAQAAKLPVTAVIGNGIDRQHAEGLAVQYLGTQVDAETRLLPFYVGLPNQVQTTHSTADGRRYVSWQYVPGQRVTLEVPIEAAQQRIVLPADAVAADGVESCVFRRNGDVFERVAVQLLHQSPEQTVLVDDGSLFPGDVIALRGAHQLLLALRNQSGGGVDPHHGHSH